MQLAFITPTAYLEKYAIQGDILLALAHLVDAKAENDYSRFHKRESKRGKRLILDNGLFEGSQVSITDLLDRASAIEASMVCAPDVLYDSKGTIKAFKQFIRAKQDAGLVAEVMGIPQGETVADWWESFHFFQTNPDCDMIGLSILSVPKCFGEKFETNKIVLSRMELIKQLHAMDQFGVDLKPCHMLGLGEGYADILLANRLLPKVIVSNDSSSAFVHGIYAEVYDQFGYLKHGKISEKLDFNIRDIVHDQHVQTNINIAKEAAKSKSVFELRERIHTWI